MQHLDYYQLAFIIDFDSQIKWLNIDYLRTLIDLVDSEQEFYEFFVEFPKAVTTKLDLKLIKNY